VYSEFADQNRLSASDAMDLHWDDCRAAYAFGPKSAFSALQTYPAILGPSATMPLLSIPSHISKGPVPLSIYSFVLGLGSSEHDELQDSQYKVKYRNQHHGVHSHMVSGADLDVFSLVSQIQES